MMGRGCPDGQMKESPSSKRQSTCKLTELEAVAWGLVGSIKSQPRYFKDNSTKPHPSVDYARTP